MRVELDGRRKEYWRDSGVCTQFFWRGDRDSLSLPCWRGTLCPCCHEECTLWGRKNARTHSAAPGFQWAIPCNHPFQEGTCHCLLCPSVTCNGMCSGGLVWRENTFKALSSLSMLPVELSIYASDAGVYRGFTFRERYRHTHTQSTYVKKLCITNTKHTDWGNS